MVDAGGKSLPGPRFLEYAGLRQRQGVGQATYYGLDLRLFADRRNPQWYSRIYRTIRNRVRALIDPYPETKKARS